MGPKRVKDDILESSCSSSKEDQKLKRMRNDSFNVKVRSWKPSYTARKQVKKVPRTKAPKKGHQLTDEVNEEIIELQVENVPHASCSTETDSVTPGKNIEDNFKLYLESIVNELGEIDDMARIRQPKEKKRSRQDFMRNYKENWDNLRPLLHQSLISQHAPPDPCFCGKCGQELKSVISCTTCSFYLCEHCDSTIHYHLPFHTRKLYTGNQYVYLHCNIAVVNGSQVERRRKNFI